MNANLGPDREAYELPLFTEPKTELVMMIEVADRVYVVVIVLCCHVKNVELTIPNDVNDAHFSI